MNNEWRDLCQRGKKLRYSISQWIYRLSACCISSVNLWTYRHCYSTYGRSQYHGDVLFSLSAYLKRLCLKRCLARLCLNNHGGNSQQENNKRKKRFHRCIHFNDIIEQCLFGLVRIVLGFDISGDKNCEYCMEWWIDCSKNEISWSACVQCLGGFVRTSHWSRTFNPVVLHEIFCVGQNKMPTNGQKWNFRTLDRWHDLSTLMWTANTMAWSFHINVNDEYGGPTRTSMAVWAKSLTDGMLFAH